MYNNSLYITATQALAGKSAIVMGMLQLLTRNLRKVAFFRPIIDEARQRKDRDHDIDLMLRHFKLDLDYKNTFAYTLDEALDLINRGKRNVLMENILQSFKALTADFDFVLCEGTDFLGKDPSYECELNADIAASLASPVMLVINGSDMSADDVQQSALLQMEQFQERMVDVIAIIVNRAALTEQEINDLRAQLPAVQGTPPPLFYSIPRIGDLDRPTMGDVKNWLNASVVYGETRLDARVGEYLIAAMQIDNFLNYVKQDHLIITPGDRSDLILASIATRLSSSAPNIAGILLTGGIEPCASMRKLIEGWTETPLPILLTEHHTYKTVQMLHRLHSRISPSDQRKISTVLDTFEQHVNSKEVGSRIMGRRSHRITPMMFEFDLLERARKNRMRIVLAEGEEARILQATDILLRRDVAEIILLGNKDKIEAKSRELGLDMSKARIIQPDISPELEDYANTYYHLRKSKGISEEQARDRMLDPTYFGTMMVYKSHADGMVSGSINTTAHTIRPAFEFIKTRKDCSIVSSAFFMCLKDRVLVFGDCAVNPNPTAHQLAEIALASGRTAEIFGIEPRVAMISYSTGASGKGPDVDTVVEATKIAKGLNPHLLLEGPMQYDAAIDPTVAKTKLPGSAVAGKATVFIFPDLNTGNTTYKAVQRAANAIAIGPLLQGLNKPVNDLSRGCTVPDIVNTVAITALQAASEKDGAQNCCLL